MKKRTKIKNGKINRGVKTHSTPSSNKTVNTVLEIGLNTMIVHQICKFLKPNIGQDSTVLVISDLLGLTPNGSWHLKCTVPPPTARLLPAALSYRKERTKKWVATCPMFFFSFSFCSKILCFMCYNFKCYPNFLFIFRNCLFYLSFIFKFYLLDPDLDIGFWLIGVGRDLFWTTPIEVILIIKTLVFDFKGRLH